MPWGLPICALRASVRRTSASVSTGSLSGWDTPTSQNAKHGSLSPSEQKRDPNVLHNQVYLAGWTTPDGSAMNDGEKLETFEARRAMLKTKGYNGNGAGMPIAVQAQLAGWPSPTAKDRDASGSSQPRTDSHHPGTTLTEAARLTGWPSPQAHDWTTRGNTEAENHHYPHDLSNAAALAGWNSLRATDGPKGGPNQSGGALSHDAHLAGWATPATRDYKDSPNDSVMAVNPDGSPRVRLDTVGRQARLSTAPTGGGGGFQLNPAFSLWLQTGDSAIHDVIASCPRGLVPSKPQVTR